MPVLSLPGFEHFIYDGFNGLVVADRHLYLENCSKLTLPFPFDQVVSFTIPIFSGWGQD